MIGAGVVAGRAAARRAGAGRGVPRGLGWVVVFVVLGACEVLAGVAGVSGVERVVPGRVERVSMWTRAGVLTADLPGRVRVDIRPDPRGAGRGGGRVVVAVVIGLGELDEADASVAGPWRGAARASAYAWTARAEGAGDLDARAGPGGAGWPRADALPRGVALSRQVQGEGVTLRWWGPSEALGAILEQLAAMLERPGVDADRLEEWRQAAGLQAAARDLDREQRVSALVLRALWPGAQAEPALLTPTQIAALSAGAVEAFTRRAAQAAPVRVAIAGDVAAPAALAAVQRTLGRLAPGERPWNWADAPAAAGPRPVAPRGGREPIDLIIPDEPAAAATGGGGGVVGGGGGAWVRLLVGVGPRMRDLSGVRVAYVAGEVARRAGERAAAASGLDPARVRVQATVLPGRAREGSGMLMLGVRVEPKRVGRAAGSGPGAADAAEAARERAAASAVLDGLAALLLNGGEDLSADVEAAKRRLADDARARLSEASYWALVLPLCGLHGVDPESIAAAPEAYAGIDGAEVDAVLRAWLDPGSRIELRIGPAPAPMTEPATAPAVSPRP